MCLLDHIVLDCMMFVFRKLKNRVAAQTARDRKKQRMTELEEALANLQAKNAKLTAENEALRKSSSDIVQENDRLKQCLEMLTPEGAGGNASHVKCEPAVFDTPLPWERTWTAFQLAAFCVAFLALVRYICVHFLCIFCAFSALTQLVGWPEGHPACKKLEWWGAGMAICLERDADLHMAQLMPLPLTVSCFSTIQIGFTFLVPAHPGSPGKRAVKRVCVCVVCVPLYLY